ncbi:MAG: hypothetical protein ACXVJY_16810, partial [Ilumatobacteraceae bacterium]
MWPWPLYPVGGYVAWAVLSGLWSVSPQTTAVQSIVGVGIAAFGAWFGWCLSARAQISAVVLAVGAAVVASALVVLFLPQYGKMYPDLAPNDRWQGIFGNRNSLAPICALLLIALVGYVALHPTIRRVAISLPLAVSAVVLLRGSAGATSVAALLATAVATVAVPFVWLLKRTRVPAAAVATGATVSLAACWLFVMTHIDRVASWMSRDATLTGRRPIWSDVR